MKPRKAPSRTSADPLPSPPTHSAAVGNALDRQLPQSTDAERALLGSMLLEREAIGEAITVLHEAGGAAFFFERHQKLYDLIVELYDRDKAIDGIVIKDELVRRGWFEELGGFDFLAGLASAVPSALRVRDYAQIVRDKYLLRQLIGALYRAMEIAFADAEPTESIFDFTERELFRVTERRVSGEAQTLPALIRDVFEQIEARDENVLTGKPTGFIELDELTCGLQPSEFIVIAGRPSMGKTALGLNMAEHLAIVEGQPVLFFSLEMSRQQLAQRTLCSRARVDSHRLRRGRLSGLELERLKATANEMGQAPLYVDDTSRLTILELRARARMGYRKHGVRAIFVDYLQLMHALGAENRQTEVAEISCGLKALAKELNVPVVAMAQLNRSSEDRSRQGNRPRMSDLRESGAIEQDADVVMLLHRESYYKPADDSAAPEDNTADLIVAKQRNGPVDTIKLHWSRQFTRFDNHDPRGYEPAYVSDNVGDVEFP